MKLVFATNNSNKLSEIRSLVKGSIDILSLKDINCNEELPETNFTIEENALEKAKYIFDNYGLNCFADDTGLEIKALDGDPGVFSARYAGEPSNAENNIKKVLSNLQAVNNREANFRTVIAIIINGKETLFKGICNGSITRNKIGQKGFGYDPIFIPDSFAITFAQMTREQKNAISHRGKAVQKLIRFLINL